MHMPRTTVTFPETWTTHVIRYLLLFPVTACFPMELSDETNMDTFPGALNGSIISGAFAKFVEMKLEARKKLAKEGPGQP